MDSYEGYQASRVAGAEAGLVRSEYKWLLRPASAVEMMDDSISIYHENFPFMVRVSLLLYLYPIVLTLLFLLPVAYLEATTPAVEAIGPAFFLECCSLILIGPYFLLLTPVHSIVSSLIAYHYLQREPITLAQIWERLKPRLGHIIGNQLLAYVVLGIIYGILYIAFVIGIMGVFIGGALTAGGALSGIIIASLLTLVLSIVFLLLSGAVSVWFILLPQILIFEPETDALTAFSRSIQLVQRNFMHALTSCLLFWGLQAVVTLAVYSLLGILIGIAWWLITTYIGDALQIYTQWSNTVGKITNIITYIGFMVIMPPMYLTSFLLYFDLRYRQEGLDIHQLLMQGVRAPA